MSFEYRRIYFVYQHKRSGIIVDNIFSPVKEMVSKVPQMVLKPFVKKR